jgi:hypothetical protein
VNHVEEGPLVHDQKVALDDASIDQKIPCIDKQQGCWMQKIYGVCNKFVENLPLILVNFFKVRRHIEHDLAPLFIGQKLFGHST